MREKGRERESMSGKMRGRGRIPFLAMSIAMSIAALLFGLVVMAVGQMKPNDTGNLHSDMVSRCSVDKECWKSQSSLSVNTELMASKLIPRN